MNKQQNNARYKEFDDEVKRLESALQKLSPVRGGAGGVFGANAAIEKEPIKGDAFSKINASAPEAFFDESDGLVEDPDRWNVGPNDEPKPPQEDPIDERIARLSPWEIDTIDLLDTLSVNTRRALHEALRGLQEDSTLDADRVRRMKEAGCVQHTTDNRNGSIEAKTPSPNNGRANGKPARKKTPHVMTEPKRRKIVSLVRSGFSRRQAAALAGVDRTTVQRAAKRDADFERQLKQAAAAGDVQPLMEIVRASKHSWRAAAWLLRHCEARAAKKEEARQAKSE